MPVSSSGVGTTVVSSQSLRGFGCRVIITEVDPINALQVGVTSSKNVNFFLVLQFYIQLLKIDVEI